VHERIVFGFGSSLPILLALARMRGPICALIDDPPSNPRGPDNIILE